MPTVAELFAQAARHYQAGRVSEAEGLCREILEQNPQDASATQLLGIIAHRGGDVSGAIELLRRAATFNPIAPDIQSNLGGMLAGTGKWDEAIAAFEHSISLRSDLPEPHLNLAKALGQVGQTDRAVEAYRRAIAIRPDYFEAIVNLGIVLHSQGRFDEAAQVYRRAISARPGAAEPHINLGIALLELGRAEDAIVSLRQAITLQPASADAWYNLAGALRRAGDLDEAVAVFNQCITLRPEFADAHANLGNALRDRGELDAAFECYRKAMSMSAASWPAQSLVYSLYFHADYDAERILAEHRKWNEIYARPHMRGSVSHSNDRDPDRRLRIGYVSPDFRNHCQANFTIPLLGHHDHERFEVFCYSSVRRPDEMTSRIRGHADVWREIAMFNDDDAADLIARDSIDILVDLSMHMDQSRLLVFARKPAPVHVSWLAYPGTTGLETMDYRLSDPQLDPPAASTDGWYTEKTVRLPDTFWCYDPLAGGIGVNELPALCNGYITFGCLNNFCKITDVTLDLWAEVMGAIPSSRLIVLTPRGWARERLLEKFSKRGIERGRVEPIDRLPREAYLAAYNRFDLCLDTVPYTGHTTTLDALWMGLPPITLAGKTAVSRGGLSLLHNVNLSEFVAQTPEEAVRIASGIAGDLARLAEIRRSLRGRMEASPLMDGPRFARNMEAAYRSMWREWCAK